ncbi:putative caltractin [Leishmania infantum JPCM5]|uniref:Caltractin_-_putative n=4 Tax=Leishmania donovani species complex TaxID=38574 RepID=A0A6L0XWU5_LEIIN|nr:putative caltractin [Leishmania infantum JPCM5]XP_003865371.1 caltractin, putative [Leishmania donovani]CAC9550405.1 caltractin_-_putative [Leishmania infantum]AYU83606.1 caltractin, putative [Leishmania donovani]CAM72527.1 putative caltractin [Leishmania infantum JPCM5]CBZ38694.1 caltractin, putative [Leishmania donovani]SUZ46631.1 caltractin_-_putative [Leishmania infantum]|eukprot:XP_001469418.1 putative caltractin [Leishmania infantum JPCM5]
MQDAGRALYTVTGQRVARSELLKLIAFAQNAVAKQQQELQNRQDQVSSQQRSVMTSAGSKNSQDATTVADNDATRFAISTRSSSRTGESMSNFSVRESSPATQQATPSTVAASAAAFPASPSAAASVSQIRFVSPHSHLLDSSEGIDLDVFEQIVLRKLKHRSYEEELAYTFALLEDKSYPGFITKESVRRIAAETGEPLTEAEIAEMFDPLVTGVSTAAVDLSTFTDLQLKARKAEDS